VKIKYDEAYKQEEIRLWWENAPGKNVILNALEFYLKGVNYKSYTLVDIGCGTGYFLNKIYNKFYIGHLIGIDISLEAITQGKNLYSYIDLRCDDGGRTIIESNSVDCVIGYGCYEHFTDPQTGLSEASRILKKNGLFFLMIPALGIDRTDRSDEGWYEEKEIPGQPIRQMQWNLRRETWESKLKNAGLELFDFELPKKYGAIKPGVFFFGIKSA
jgi:SAM-dependent methyltransferase